MAGQRQDGGACTRLTRLAVGETLRKIVAQDQARASSSQPRSTLRADSAAGAYSLTYAEVQQSLAGSGVGTASRRRLGVAGPGKRIATRGR